MLVNGQAKDPDGNSIIVDEAEIIEVFEKILEDHNRKGERSDIIIQWALTALSKLTIRLKTIQPKVKEITEQYTDHMNVEIQQRACEFIQLFENNWDQEREGIFEPIPFKGDENMLVDATDRPIFDDEDGEKDLFINPDSASQDQKKARETRKQHETE